MTTKYIDWTKFSTFAVSALSQGAENHLSRIQWDTSLGCSKPYEVTLASQPPDSSITALQPLREGETRWIDISVPCRKCVQCLLNRQKLWQRRATLEILNANRTWLGTLTISPHNRFIFSLRAKSRDYHASYGEISKEITKYFKRLRKAGHQFRYVLVAEAHKDGYPHIHVLIHEGSTPIPKRVLKEHWPYGFTDFRLTERSKAAARYVSKYLSKDARTRIRASQQYGQSVRDLSAEFPHSPAFSDNFDTSQ